MLALNIDAIRGVLPDVTFLLLHRPARRRASAPAPPADRIEREGDDFLRVRSTKAYRELGSIFAGRIVTIDGVPARRRDREGGA